MIDILILLSLICDLIIGKQKLFQKYFYNIKCFYLAKYNILFYFVLYNHKITKMSNNQNNYK